MPLVRGYSRCDSYCLLADVTAIVADVIATVPECGY